MVKKLTFEDRYKQIFVEIEKRHKKWDLAIVPFEDARQIILVVINKNYHTYNEKKGEFVKWVNKVITNAIYNIWRDNLTKYSKPCILGCVFNTGGETCSKTSSGKQCSECPLYRKWEKRKKSHHAVKQPLPLDNHAQEVGNIQSDFLDIDAAKKIIDAKMKERLIPREYKIYYALMIQNKPEEEVAKLLGPTKKQNKSRMYLNYQQLLALRHKFVTLAKMIIESEDLA